MNRDGRRLGGHGHGGCDGRVRGRSRDVGSSPGSTNKRKGICAAIGEHVFTYNEKGASDQMWTTLKQIFNYTSTIYGKDISNELHNRAVVTIDKPQHTQ